MLHKMSSLLCFKEVRQKQSLKGLKVLPHVKINLNASKRQAIWLIWAQLWDVFIIFHFVIMRKPFCGLMDDHPWDNGTPKRNHSDKHKEMLDFCLISFLDLFFLCALNISLRSIVGLCHIWPVGVTGTPIPAAVLSPTIGWIITLAVCSQVSME